MLPAMAFSGDNAGGSWLIRSAVKDHQGEKAEEDTEQRTRNGEPERDIPVFGSRICLHTIFSSVRRPTFHIGEIFFEYFGRSRSDQEGITISRRIRFAAIKRVAHRLIQRACFA